MKNLSLKNVIKSIMFGVGAVGAHHYGSKFLDYKETIETNNIDEMRYTNITEQLEKLHQKTDTLIQNQSAHDQALNTLNKCKESVFNMQSSLEAGKLDEAKAHSDIVKNCIDKAFDIYTNSTNNFQMNFNLNALYDYLDSLTLFEESALVNILILSSIFLTLISLMSSLFANELINYFDLENKHPYLKKFFMIRYQFQRYYFILNFILLYLFIIVGLALNLLVFI